MKYVSLSVFMMDTVDPGLLPASLSEIDSSGFCSRYCKTVFPPVGPGK